VPMHTQEAKGPGKWVRFRSSVLAEIETIQSFEERQSFSNTVEKLVGEALAARHRRSGRVAPEKKTAVA
jgi:hypothetical protein